MDLDLRAFTGSALTSARVEVPERASASDIGEGIPVTYVPARNIIFLSVAAGLCETIGARGHLHRRQRHRLLRISRLQAGVL